MNAIGTSVIDPRSHSAQYVIPACSETTWPRITSAVFLPDVRHWDARIADDPTTCFSHPTSRK